MAILAAELRPTLSCLLVDGFSPSSSSPVLVSQHRKSSERSERSASARPHGYTPVRDLH
jgi:hypothetical protein